MCVEGTSYTCLRIWTIVLDAILLCIGGAMLCIGIWVSIDSTTTFLTGEAIVLYGFDFVTVLVFISAIILLFTASVESKNGLGVYAGVAGLTLLFQIGMLGFYAFSFELERGMLLKLWNEVGQPWKDKAQTHFGCCGYTDATDYLEVENGTIPASCYNGTQIYNVACGNAMYDYFTSIEVYPLLVIILIIPAIFEITCYILSLILARAISKRKKSKSLEKNKPKRNQVRPVNGDDQNDGYSTPVRKSDVVLREHEPNRQQMASQPPKQPPPPYSVSEPQPSTSHQQPATTIPSKQTTDPNQPSTDKPNPLLNVASALLNQQNMSAA